MKILFCHNRYQLYSGEDAASDFARSLLERGGAWIELGYRFSSFLYTTGEATVLRDGNLQPRPLLGPFVVLVCAAVQLIATRLNRLWPSRQSTVGYGVLAVKN